MFGINSNKQLGTWKFTLHLPDEAKSSIEFINLLFYTNNEISLGYSTLSLLKKTDGEQLFSEKITSRVCCLDQN